MFRVFEKPHFCPTCLPPPNSSTLRSTPPNHQPPQPPTASHHHDRRGPSNSGGGADGHRSGPFRPFQADSRQFGPVRNSRLEPPRRVFLLRSTAHTAVLIDQEPPYDTAGRMLVFFCCYRLPDGSVSWSLQTMCVFGLNPPVSGYFRWPVVRPMLLLAPPCAFHGYYIHMGRRWYA